MNYNLLTYLAYTVVTFTIIFYLGNICFNNGKPFISREIKDQHLSQRINKSLLLGYYLVNLGFVLFTFNTWPSLQSVYEIIIELSSRIGYLLLILGFLHYCNIFFISILLKKLINT